MNALKKLLGLLAGLAALGALLWAAWLGVGFVASLFEGLDPQVAKVTAIASVVVLASSLVVASAIRDAARKSKA
ncbi:MAG TPA: hypothetical protein VFB01_01710 [Burkholderiales bacterium]|nr:hypothetical protein [Burkholderiales bacterium]